MGQTIINTIIVRNVSNQTVTINIDKKSDSIIFTKFGQVKIPPFTSVEAEDPRFNLGQLTSLQRLRLISITHSIQAFALDTSVEGTDIPPPPPPPPFVRRFVIGFGTSIILRTDNTIWSWGPSTGGRIGDNATSNRSSPVSVVGDHNFVKIFNGRGNADISGAIKDDGNIWNWGEGSSGGLGQDSVTVDRSSPVSVVGDHSFIETSSGSAHNAGLKVDGTLWKWGTDSNGRLGRNTQNENKSSPVSVIGDHSFVDVQSGTSNTVARKDDGTAWAWGLNSSGRLGDDTIINRSSPVSVIGDHSFVEIGMSTASAGCRKEDGSVWTWGEGTTSELGQGTVAVDRSSPISVVGDHSFINVQAANNHMLAMKSDGTAWAWGFNTFGSLGDDTTNGRSSPISVIGDHSFIVIAAGGATSGGYKEDGSIWTWGQNTSGQVGDNTTANRSSPVSVVGLDVN